MHKHFIVTSSIAVSLASTLYAGAVLSNDLGGLSFGGLNLADLEKQAEQMTSCFDEIPEDELDALGKKFAAYEQQIEQLCAAGKRRQAQSTAIELFETVIENPTMLKMRQCSEKLTGMMAQMMPKLPKVEEYYALDDKHICDD